VSPRLPLRAKGAELALKYRNALEGLMPDEAEDVMLPGVILVCPQPTEQSSRPIKT